MRNAQSRHGKKWMGTMALATAVLGGVMLFAGASNAKAVDWDDHSYHRQVRYTEWRHENHEAREREKHFRHEYRERHERYHRDRY